MSQSIKSKVLSFELIVRAGTTYTSTEELVNTFTTSSFDIASTGEVTFTSYAGKFNNDGDYVELDKKTFTKFYTKTINTVSNFIFVQFENKGTSDVTVYLQTIHSFIKQNNSIVRQHKQIGNTENVTFTKPGSEFNLDLIRGLYQNQEAVDIVGSASGTSTIRHVLWGDTNNDVYDGLSIGVSPVIQCSSVLDSLVSDGAQVIKLTGLNSSFEEITESIELNGVSVQGVCPFMRINQAEITQAGASLFNVGDITIHPYFDTSLILERIGAEKSISDTFHYTVPKDKTLVLDTIDLHGVLDDPTFFYFSCQGVSSGISPYNGTPNLRTTYLSSGIANGEWSININRKFETGKTIKLDISTDPA
ncbi:MAG: hypothetical protein ACR2M9_01500, partial [Cyanophyceae cyanobacterium]